MHNHGVGFPDLPTEMIGTRRFIAPDEQSITIAGTVRMILIDSGGAEVASDTLFSLMGDIETGTIEDIRDAIS